MINQRRATEKRNNLSNKNNHIFFLKFYTAEKEVGGIKKKISEITISSAPQTTKNYFMADTNL